ncbi:outer membrane beta-barrel protein [Flavitalea sp. BT771]|uniref:outer membrane beta-barrel protein n=1 Tax=Flavitalea sp. BT771 TaxID=3063329 RepID=UPI0026E48C0D|nr:outer membrane beta-barrel protein [Flavitalea sp. BT771]MDO6433066.1 outer membrane beta-barrel protein [Flavitalea sp. BT771]MDV6221658.1 outer membrane beta-barrel protein [Flavitalea sp. BT771]
MILVLLCMRHGTLYGQTFVTGRLRDSLFRKDCSFCVVLLLRPDSTIERFVRTRKDGSFSLTGISDGSYLLLMTHPSYSTYSMPVEVRQQEKIDIGTLFLSPKSELLATATVTPRNLPPRMHGDTLEFNTSNIKTRVNATVEELLMRLPGVRVDENGIITVNGVKIERLLVDGQDIFSGAPAIVTKNFNADMIAKVQVLDKKSRQAEFTGVADGKTKKTMNLTLKEDSKRGDFAKAEASAGPGGYYNVNGLLGAFNVNRQLVILGMTGNVGSTGFSGNVGSSGSGLNINTSSGDALGASAGAGVPRVTGGGMHYGDRLNANGDHISGDYTYGGVLTRPFSTVLTSQILPDSVYTQEQRSSSVNIQDRHELNTSFDYNPDSVSAFSFSLGGSSLWGKNNLLASSGSSFNDTAVNSSLRSLHSDVENRGFQSSIMWRIRAKRKKDRNFSLLAGFDKQDNTTNGFVYSLSKFYQRDGGLKSADTLDQRKAITSDNLIVNSGLFYTEPFGKNMGLSANYGFTYSRSQSVQSTYNRGDSNKYEKYIDSLSNHYRSEVLTQGVTVNLQGQGKEFSYTVGGDISHYTYRQHDVLKKSLLEYHYLIFSPRINARLNIDGYKGLTLEYRGNTQQPSITELQPVQNNNDPLHIVIGNPGLHPGFSHSLNVAFYKLQPSVINAGLSLAMMTNSISTRIVTDDQGRQISQAVNVNGSGSTALFFSVNRKLKSLDLDAGCNTTLSFSRSVNYVNEYLSNNDSYYASGGINLGKFVVDKYSIRLNSTYLYTYSRSSVNYSALTQYWSSYNDLAVSIYLLKGYEISTNAQYNWRQKQGDFDKKNYTLLWNAYVSRNFFSNRLALRWQINDILDQNVWIGRIVNGNQVTQTTLNTIGRYWMASVSWRFIRHRKIG